MQPKVTVSFINCNRLFYLRSCIKSFIECTKDYENKELIIIDNASVESGTKEFLDEKEAEGFIVIRNPERIPSNEFAAALNKTFEISTGDYIMPLQADMQFVLQNKWLNDYVKICETRDDIGCITLDAQRNITNNSHRYSNIEQLSNYKFFIDHDRNSIAGAGDVFYSKKMLEKVYPWYTNNLQHEGGSDSETEMLQRIKQLILEGKLVANCLVPIIPPSIAIYTDERGTNARVRNNRRYGKYYQAVDDKYYEFVEYKEAIKLYKNLEIPVGIENYAIPIGWDKMLDENGNWLKNPIKPEAALPWEYEELSDTKWLNNFDSAIKKGERLSKNIDKKLRAMENNDLVRSAEDNLGNDYVDEWLNDK